MRLKLFAGSRSFAPATQIAVARLHLPSGEVLNNQVVCLDGEGFVSKYAPLQMEQAFTEWFRGDAYLR